MAKRRSAPNKNRYLYPPLSQMNGRVSGSITLGESRLPIWAIPHEFDIEQHQGTPFYQDADGKTIGDSHLNKFLFELLNVRDRQARVVLALAGHERFNSVASHERLIKALTECLQAELAVRFSR